MPISSFPISVRSSINLSDINIDTDLDMGANSIVGYALSSSIPQVKFIDITTSKLLQPDGNDYIEKLNDSTEYINTTKNDTIQISLGTWESLGFEVGDYALIRWETKLNGYMNSSAYLKSGSSTLISQLMAGGGYISFELYNLFCITSISDSLTINTKTSNEGYAMKTKDNIVSIFRFKDIKTD